MVGYLYDLLSHLPSLALSVDTFFLRPLFFRRNPQPQVALKSPLETIRNCAGIGLCTLMEIRCRQRRACMLMSHVGPTACQALQLRPSETNHLHLALTSALQNKGKPWQRGKGIPSFSAPLINLKISKAKYFRNRKCKELNICIKNLYLPKCIGVFIGFESEANFCTWLITVKLDQFPLFVSFSQVLVDYFSCARLCVSPGYKKRNKAWFLQEAWISMRWKSH